MYFSSLLPVYITEYQHESFLAFNFIAREKKVKKSKHGRRNPIGVIKKIQVNYSQVYFRKPSAGCRGEVGEKRKTKKKSIVPDLRV